VLEVHYVFRNGVRLDTRLTMYASPPPMNSEEGVMTLADGRSLHYTTTRGFDSKELVVDAGAGGKLTIAMPTKSFLELPDPSKPATGTFETPAGKVTFTLTAAGGDAWTQLETQEGTLAGTFLLGRGPMTGKGTLRSGGEVAATLTWDSVGNLKGTFADGSTAEAQPSAAVRDFMLDRWLWVLGEYGPSPR
jgi:hypothetical protein